MAKKLSAERRQEMVRKAELAQKGFPGWICHRCGSERSTKESRVECRSCLLTFGKCCSSHGDEHNRMVRGFCVACAAEQGEGK